MIDRIDLDHVAVAAEDQHHLWPRYAGDLGGVWVGGGGTPGFWSGQVQFANGMKVEVLEPFAVEQNDFLRRFLDRSGPGPHHLTYKVADLPAALAAAEAAGYRPVGVDLSDPQWQEAFLHPKDAPGVVVQLAHSSGDGDWDSPPRDDLPPSRTGAPATLLHVAHAVATMDEGLRLFAELLGGQEVARGDDEAAHWIELRWPGPGRVRLVTPASPSPANPVAAWLSSRSGRVHHLAFQTSDPGAVAGAIALAGGAWEVPPEANFGVRLVLSEG